MPDDAAQLVQGLLESAEFSIKLVRESALATERDLMADLGIHDTPTAGQQDLDDQYGAMRSDVFGGSQLPEAESGECPNQAATTLASIRGQASALVN